MGSNGIYRCGLAVAACLVPFLIAGTEPGHAVALAMTPNLAGARRGFEGPPAKDVPPGGVQSNTSIPLKSEEQKRVNEAIDRGLAYLRKQQKANGSFGNWAVSWGSWPVGFAALPALALLECGVKADDPAVEKAVRFVRQKSANLTKTYELSLAILLLDRMGEPPEIIKSLALRLAAGQGPSGGWGYNCRLLQPADEKKQLEWLRQPKTPQKPTGTTAAKARDVTDNSNTQFAILAIWAARKHQLPFEHVIRRIEHRFRSSQFPDGAWAYRVNGNFTTEAYGSMTCVGLLGLAIAHSLESEASGAKEQPEGKRLQDEGINRGLRALSRYLYDPTDSAMPAWPRLRTKGNINPYFLWSVERVGVICKLNTIGGKDWYRWGVRELLQEQKEDGSWVGTGAGGFPVIDTSFALLFLKRSDLLPGLSEKLEKAVKITDPGPDKAISPKKSPGEKTDPKSPGDKKSPGEKNDLKRGIEKKNVGALDPAGTATGGTLNVYVAATLPMPAGTASNFDVTALGVVNMYGGTIDMDTTRVASLDIHPASSGLAAGQVVGAYNGSNAREVLYTPEEWEQLRQNGRTAARA